MYSARATPHVSILQRLVEENMQQQQLLQQLLQRLENVEQALQDMQAEKAKKGLWGGFLGPRAL